MTESPLQKCARRSVLKKSVLLAGAPVLCAIAPVLLTTFRSEAALTPACGDLKPTVPQGSGPFYTPDSPLRNNLRWPGLKGREMHLSGRIYNQHCEPVAGAILDFWHADRNGVYDNRGYRLRGHMFTDSEGYYSLKTIVPGFYPGRTRHIHVTTQGEETERLTTQLYFPGEPGNQDDFAYDARLEVKSLHAQEEFQFDFILKNYT